ncbi:MAG: hypothetical protein B7Y13_10005 [Sulfurovum sp. 24-42-9]|nr:MAG: hypothetical protein B7Y13_10005 [Sulfurovum sp. 24-42-9]
MNSTIVVSDATVLIVLSKIGRYDLLSNFWESVLLPREVWEEINAKTFTTNPILSVVDAPDNATRKALLLILDAGESAAIALAHQDNLILIIDEKKGRKWAKNIGVRVIGLLGIILVNLERGLITSNDAREIIVRCDEVGFRVSAGVKERFEMEIMRYE